MIRPSITQDIIDRNYPDENSAAHVAAVRIMQAIEDPAQFRLLSPERLAEIIVEAQVEAAQNE